MLANQLRNDTIFPTEDLEPLQIAVLEKFIPQFAPRAKVLFLRGNHHRPDTFVSGALQRLNIPVDKHSKLPDVILYLPQRRLLLLLELHELISITRHTQLERLLVSCHVRREYVSVLSDWRAYSRHGNNVAWETHVWLAEIPKHLIHCNGEKFLGPPRRHK